MLMERREFLSGMAGLALAQWLAPQIARASDDQISMAIAETQKAIGYGNEPHHESSFAQHMDNAIDHAMMAQRAHPNAHTKKAISYLRRGRKVAYGSHLASRSRRGAALAAKALKQLQAVQ
jgi:hypothetical protein